MIVLYFSMQGEDIFEHTNESVKCLHLNMQGEDYLSVLMASVKYLHLSTQKKYIFEHANGKFHLCTL